MSSTSFQYLNLYFLSERDLSLNKTEFRSPLLGSTLHCSRGRLPQFEASLGTFTWSPAVRALCVLLLGSVLYEHRKEGEGAFVLGGDAGSLAASLDYAISKQPAWLLEMFGTDAEGLSILRRLLIRNNPERKRSGPVQITLNPKVFNPHDIGIFLNNQPVREPSILLAMLEKLQRQFDDRKDRSGSAAPASNQTSLLGPELHQLSDASPLSLNISQSFFDLSNPYRHYNKNIFQSLVDNGADRFSELSTKGLDRVVDELLHDLAKRPSSRRRRFICTNTTVEALGPSTWHSQHSLRKLASGTRSLLANEYHTECWRLFVLRDPSAIAKKHSLAHFHATLEDNRAMGVYTAVCSASALEEYIDYHYSDCYCVPGETTFISVTPSYLLSKFESKHTDHKSVVSRYSNCLDDIVLKSTDKNFDGAFFWLGGSSAKLKEKMKQLSLNPQPFRFQTTAA